MSSQVDLMTFDAVVPARRAVASRRPGRAGTPPALCARDEATLHVLMREAHARGVDLEVVVGAAPGWEHPWSRVQVAHVAADAWGTPGVLVDDHGWEIQRTEVQLARLATSETSGDRR
ncbi:MAG: hypothetical protein JNM38_16335 [Acidobacteria bacterium]|nr:hypothetical protein [Acidobacteriota bacterium]